MKKVIIGTTVVAMFGIVVLAFTLCAAPTHTPKSPSYLPQHR